MVNYSKHYWCSVFLLFWWKSRHDWHPLVERAFNEKKQAKGYNIYPYSRDANYNSTLWRFMPSLIKGSTEWNLFASCNRRLLSTKNPHFQNKAKRTPFPVKMSFICMRMKTISISEVEHFTSYWYGARGNSEMAYYHPRSARLISRSSLNFFSGSFNTA